MNKFCVPVLKLWYYLRTFLFIGTSPEDAEALWGFGGKDAVRKLGTVAEARKTLGAWEMSPDTRQFTDYVDWGKKGDNETLGDTNGPWFSRKQLPGIQFRVAYVVEESPSGFSREYFESCFGSLTIIRYCGRILHAHEGIVMRMERHGGVTYV